MKVLGTEYKLIDDESIAAQDLDGKCLTYTKEIHIRPVENMLDDGDSLEDKRKRYNETLRHEAVHGFFEESGLEQYSNDELLVDWIAKQFPKMFELFNELHCTR